MSQIQPFITIPDPKGVSEAAFKQISPIQIDAIKRPSLELLLNSGFQNLKSNKLYAFEKEIQARYYLGKTVVDSIVFTSPSYDVEAYDTRINDYVRTTVSPSRININAILVDVNMDRNVVTTPISGRDGTVKEYISNGDYRLEFRGILANQVSKERPIEELSRLVKILNCPVAIEVASDYLQQAYSITDMVVVGESFTMEEGEINSIYFQFTALSDKPLELQKYKIR